MFINIRGSQGSGKTTTAKALYQQYTTKKQVCKLGQKHALTLCTGSNRLNDCAFVGEYADTDPYDTDRGFLNGADTLKYTSQLITLAQFCVTHKWNMLWECSFMQSASLYKEIATMDHLLILNLTVDLHTVAQRRANRSVGEIKSASVTNPTKLSDETPKISALDNVTVEEVDAASVTGVLEQYCASQWPSESALWDLKCSVSLDTSKKNMQNLPANLFDLN